MKKLITMLVVILFTFAVTGCATQYVPVGIDTCPKIGKKPELKDVPGVVRLCIKEKIDKGDGKKSVCGTFIPDGSIDVLKLNVELLKIQVNSCDALIGEGGEN